MGSGWVVIFFMAHSIPSDVFGPFATRDEAVAWGSREFHGRHWCSRYEVAALSRPTTGAVVRCTFCGASTDEIGRDGHRRIEGRACPEACTCMPEHVSLAEHRADK